MSFHTILRIVPILLLAGLVAAQSDETKLSAVKDFKEYWRRNKDVASRMEAVMSLRGNECPPAAEELIDLLDHKEESIRGAAMAVLSTFRKPETFAAFTAALPTMKKMPRRAQLIDVLSQAQIRDILPVLREMALHDGKIDTQVRVAICRAMGRFPASKDNDPVLTAFLKSTDPIVRIAAVDLIGKHRLRELGVAAVPLLADRVWQVQAAAIQAVGQARVAAAIDPLIALMKGNGRFRTDTAEALFLITTKDYGSNPEQWEKSMNFLRGQGWKIPTDAEVAKAKASRQRSDAFYGKKPGGKKTFAKITTTSTRVLFIIDVSGSMEAHVVEKDKFDAGYDDYSKLTIVKTELINTIEALDKNTYFNIVAFASGLKTWQKDLVAANKVRISSARRWVQKLKPIGGSEASEMARVGLSSNVAAGKTNTFKALMYPFNIDGDKPQTQSFTGGLSKSMLKSKLDTVFFLSDGRPSVGRHVDTEVILREVRKMNQHFRIVFHAIAIGQGTPKAFLQTLAMDSGGEFVDLGN